VITADGSTGTTAVAGNGYFIDTTSAAHTITLPSSPSIGDTVAIKDYAGTFGTNNLTIARNSSNIQGVANDSLISTNRASLTLVYVDATKGWLYAVESNVADLQQALFVTATGGTVTESGDYKIHTFTGDGCFVVSCGGNPVGNDKVDYLVVAGGGGGGPGNGTGGGGAGGFRESYTPAVSGPYTASPLKAVCGALTVSTTTYPVTVGAGGAYTGSGSNSVFSTITSAGGGRFAVAGGSGGGGAYAGSPEQFGAAGNTPPVSPPQGNSGGDANPSTPNVSIASGGGGGATAAGGNANPNRTDPGDGGAGATTSISGSPTAYAGGGGGGQSGPAPNNYPGGTGGTGGGGPGGGPSGSPSEAGTSGTTNTGGGGGGGGGTYAVGSQPGGAGGSGLVIIRYKFQ
jgi:hypothetical protein